MDEGDEGPLEVERDDVVWEEERLETGDELGLDSGSWSNVLLSLFSSSSPSYIVLSPSLTSISLNSACRCDLITRNIRSTRECLRSVGGCLGS